MADPSVSVVVPTRGVPVLEDCLAALGRQLHAPVEVVVVVDGGAAEVAGRVRNVLPEAAVVDLPVAVGFAAAVNSGVRAAAGSVLAILNDDAEPEPGWLAESLACLERHPWAASVASKVVSRTDPGLLDGCGDSLTRSLKAYRRGQGERDRGQFEREEEVFGSSGTACLWRADVFAELGGYDERFGAYYEDVDLSFRARLAGHEIWYAPRAVVAHVGGATAGPAAARYEADAVRNRWATIVKDVPAPLLLRLAPFVVAGEALGLGRAVAERRLVAYGRGYGTLLASARSWLLARKDVQQERTATPAELSRLLQRSFPPLSSSLRRRRPAAPPEGGA